MSLKAGIFNSTTVETTEEGLVRGDKAVDAAYIAKLLAALLSNGVCTHVGSGFKTGAVGGEAGASTAMQVKTGSGACMIEGHFAYDNGTETHTFTVSPESRIAARIYRLDTSAGTLLPLWKECIRQDGNLVTKTENQILPVRSGTVYDLVTAVVELPAGTARITDGMITDLREDPVYCGVAHAHV